MKQHSDSLKALSSIAIDDEIDDLKFRIEMLNSIRNTIVRDDFFTLTFPLGKITWRKEPVPSAIGVYLTEHIPTGQIGYIGQGNLLQRRSRQRTIFKNNGQPYYAKKNGKITSSVDHPGARKMYAYDPKINNWQIHMRVLHDKGLAQRIEAMMQEQFVSMFNDQKMAGC